MLTLFGWVPLKKLIKGWWYHSVINLILLSPPFFSEKDWVCFIWFCRQNSLSLHEKFTEMKDDDGVATLKKNLESHCVYVVYGNWLSVHDVEETLFIETRNERKHTERKILLMKRSSSWDALLQNEKERKSLLILKTSRFCLWSRLCLFCEVFFGDDLCGSQFWWWQKRCCENWKISCENSSSSSSLLSLLCNDKKKKVNERNMTSWVSETNKLFGHLNNY